MRSSSSSGEYRGVWRKLWAKKGIVAEEEDEEEMILQACDKCHEERKEVVE